MSDFVRQLVQLCMFKLGPEDLPTNRTLLLVCAAAATFSYILTDTVYDTTNKTVSFAVAQMAAFAGIIWLLLKFKGFSERWMQTMTALFGAAALLQFIGWPFAVMIRRSQETGQNADWAVLILLALGLWFLLVMAKVIRHAVEVTPGLSIMIAFASQSLVVLVLIMLFGPLPAAS